MSLLLRDLEPRFIRCDTTIAEEDHGRRGPDGEIQWGGFPVDVNIKVESLTEADGISFLCPGCFTRNGGAVGTHRINVFFEGRGAPPHIGLNSSGVTSRWDVMGNDFLDLTLHPSIHVRSGCGWHGFVKHGMIESV